MMESLAYCMHLGVLLLSSWFACAGGWTFGGGRLRRGLLLGAVSLAMFFVDHWVFD